MRQFYDLDFLADYHGALEERFARAKAKAKSNEDREHNEEQRRIHRDTRSFLLALQKRTKP